MTVDPLAWLQQDVIGGPNVASWTNPLHPGYAYPEAAGLLIRWMAQRDRLPPTAVLESLVDAVQRDAVGRAGITYAFDTGVVLTGLDAVVPDDPRWTAARSRLAERLRARAVTTPTVAPRWSTTPGPHMLKLAVGTLVRARRGAATPLRDVLAAWPFEQRDDGLLHTPPHAATYLHAHAYATEGLLALAQLGVDTANAAAIAIDALARMQSPDGSLPAWSDGTVPGRCDTTAQAVRLFILHDRERLRGAIETGLAFLDRHTDERGATAYEAGSDDRNTWTTLFTAQARAWARDEAGACVEGLL
ncbi:MAG: hypothetical protein AAGA54_21410 [Myxococcota bacterium]